MNLDFGLAHFLLLFCSALMAIDLFQPRLRFPLFFRFGIPLFDYRHKTDNEIDIEDEDLIYEHNRIRIVFLYLGRNECGMVMFTKFLGFEIPNFVLRGHLQKLDAKLVEVSVQLTIFVILFPFVLLLSGYLFSLLVPPILFGLTYLVLLLISSSSNGLIDFVDQAGMFGEAGKAFAEEED